jgi:hypothetical protein
MLAAVMGKYSIILNAYNVRSPAKFLIYIFLNRSILRCPFNKLANPTHQAIAITKATHHHMMNNSVVQMKALSALNRLLVLSDEMLSIVDLETLNLVRHLKFKAVTTFCLNENPISEDPFSVEICIGSKKKIYYILLNNDLEVKILKEFPINSNTSSLAMDEVSICLSMNLEYYMLDSITGEMQQLFSRDNPQQPPLIHRVSRVFFLVNFYNSYIHTHVINF